jgi:hypothetical protein
LRAVQYSEHLHLPFADFVNCDEGKRDEHELTRILDSAGTLTFVSWNQVATWLSQLEALRKVASTKNHEGNSRFRSYSVRKATMGLNAEALRAGK